MAEYIKTRFGQEENIDKGYIMQTWTDKQDLGNGIFCYKGVIKKEIDVINRLESNLKPVGDTTGYAWLPAYVGYKQLILNMTRAQQALNFRSCGKMYMMHKHQQLKTIVRFIISMN